MEPIHRFSPIYFKGLVNRMRALTEHSMDVLDEVLDERDTDPALDIFKTTARGLCDRSTLRPAEDARSKCRAASHAPTFASRGCDDGKMLQGEIVTLRAVEREDVPRLHELLKTDLEVMTRASDRQPRPVSLEEMIASFEKAWEEEEADAWFAVVVDDELVGECGLHDIDLYQGTCHVGISLGRAHWSKGYGRDAIRILLDFAFRHLRMRKVGLEVLADDERAVRAYTAAGFVEEGRLREEAWFDGSVHDVLRMSVLRSEWEVMPRPSENEA